MTDNANFTALAADNTAMLASFDIYKVARANAVKGGVEATAIRNGRRADLLDLVQALADNVSAIAKGDEEKLMSSGFPLQKATHTSVGPLSAPRAPKVKQGIACQAIAATKPVYGGSIYTARLALASAPTVYQQTMQKTGARFEFNGLTAGELYNVQINVTGFAGVSDWSDVGSLRVI